MSNGRYIACVLLLLSLVASVEAQKNKAAVYFPEPGSWQNRSPESVGFDSQALQRAVDFARAHESTTPRNLEEAHYQSFGREPFGDAIGPFITRGDPAGLIIRKGYIVASWGDPARVEMTFSVTKSFLSSTVGLAFDRGMLKVDDTVFRAMAPVYPYKPVPDAAPGDRYGEHQLVNLFDTPHNRTITWDHLLRQTSDWEGTLWGKPEWADRPTGDPSEWRSRARHEPGTVWEYNDVRVNALALAATNVWRKALPAVLKELIMDPIGASSSWRWIGYDNSWIVLDGQQVQAVGGGGHWGGGMFINAYDMARFGYLTLKRGNWNGKQLLSDRWVTLALTPTTAQPTYGFMNWFLNTDRKYYPNAPASAFAHIGNGTNMIYVDPDHDLVIVARWIENGAINEFLGKVLSALR